MFLQTDELEVLTGYRRKADQRSQLIRMGIPFFINSHGRAVVVRDSLVLSADGVTQTPTGMPDFHALRQLEDGS